MEGGRPRGLWVERYFPCILGLFLSYPPLSPHWRTSLMSQTHPSHPDSESEAFSYSNYQHIFSHALESYKKRTGNDLTSHPLFPRLRACDSPDAVIALLRQQIPGFDRSRSDDSGRLSNWLNSTVNVIISFSRVIGGSVGLVGLREFYSESRCRRIFSRHFLPRG
jgi:hypothetical protein